MVSWEIHDVRNDIQKSSMKTLPTNDCVFVFVLCAVPFFPYADVYAASRFQRKTIGTFQEKQVLPKIEL